MCLILVLKHGMTLVLITFDLELLQSHRWLLAEIDHAYLLRPVLHMR